MAISDDSSAKIDETLQNQDVNPDDITREDKDMLEGDIQE